MAIIKPSQLASGSYNITGSLHGTSSYAVTASYVVSGSGITIGSTPLTSGTSTRILYQSGSVVQQDAGFLFDPTNKTLTNYGKGGLTNNTSFGVGALVGTTTGDFNTAIGRGALGGAYQGSYNTALGFASLSNVIAGYFTGNGNIGIGYYSGGYITSGQYNIAIGYSAGTSLTTGDRNTLLGSVTVASSTTSNNVVIGDGSGNNAIWKDASNYVGIGYNHLTETLAAKLDVKAAGALSTDIVFRIRNSIDNDNLTYIGGNGLAIIGINSSTSPTLILDPAGSTRARLRANSSVSIDLNNSGWNNLNGGAGGWDIEATGGEIRQRNGSNYTLLSGNYFGIGRTPSARLDVQAQGALSTDIAFRVRNSADNNNLITITGDGNITVGNSSAVPSTSTLRVFSGFGGGNFLNLINDSTSFGVYQGLDMAHTGRPGYFALETAGNQGSSITRFRGGGSNSANAKITAYIDHPGDTDKTGHWHFRTQVHLGDAYRAYQSTLGNHTLLIETGSTPTTSSANSFILYSSASSASNAAPHFRTENGSIIKLYKEIQPALSGSANTGDPATDALIEAMKTIILNLGFGSSS